MLYLFSFLFFLIYYRRKEEGGRRKEEGGRRKEEGVYYGRAGWIDYYHH
jgi:hypothetical protein